VRPLLRRPMGKPLSETAELILVEMTALGRGGSLADVGSPGSRGVPKVLRLRRMRTVSDVLPRYSWKGTEGLAAAYQKALPHS
jgi:hypothetical protein